MYMDAMRNPFFRQQMMVNQQLMMVLARMGQQPMQNQQMEGTQVKKKQEHAPKKKKPKKKEDAKSKNLLELEVFNIQLKSRLKKMEYLEMDGLSFFVLFQVS